MGNASTKTGPRQSIDNVGGTPYLGHMDTPDQITTREAAELLGKSVRATIRLVESGKLQPIRKFPGLRGPYIFDRDTIETFSDRM